MIADIHIEGFKSLKKADIKIKPITVLIGLNSSGKSSVLQFLEVLKQTVLAQTSNLITDGNLIKLGQFKDLVFQKKEEGRVSFELNGSRDQFLNAPFGKETKYNYSFSVDARGLTNHRCSITSGDLHLTGKYERGKTNDRFQLEFLNGNLVFTPSNIIGLPFNYVGASGSLGDLNWDDLNNKFLPVINQELRDFFMVPAIRGVSSPSYPLDSQASEDIIDTYNLYEQSVKVVSTVVYKSPEMERKINGWISRVTGITIRARTVPDKRGAIEASRNVDANIVNEGFGSNQLVHLFAQIAAAPQNCLIGIEEPEVHLHPKAQSELAKVLAEISQQEKKNLIITTHSEHILQRLLIEIAKGNLTTKELAVYHFRLSKEGATEVEELSVDEKGKLSKGLPDFFDLDLEEFRDLLKSLKA